MSSSDTALLDRSVQMRELFAGRASGALGLLLLLVGVAYSGITFAPLVDPLGLTLWAGAFALVFLVWTAILLLPFFRIPPDAEIARLWLPLLRSLAFIANALTAASIWLFLPVADADLRGLMTALYIWFIVVQLMAETRASGMSHSATVLVTGSLALYELLNPRPYSIALALFLLVFAASMLAFRQLLRRTTLDAIRARLLAERAGAQLDLALRESEAQRDAITRFLAAASHDLQQPVQAASLFFDRAIDAAAAPDRDRAIDGARRAFASTQALLGEMLDHLRFESGVTASGPVALGPLFAEIALEHEARADQAGVAILIAPTRAVAHADPIALRRILGNLVVNALVHSGTDRLLIGVRRTGDRLRIHVIDCGRGITGDPARLFDGDPATAVRPGHYGLGLPSSRRAARAMGGDLAIEPRWRRGACFILRLDAVAATPRAPQADEGQPCKAA